MWEAFRKTVGLSARKIIHALACILHFNALGNTALLYRQQRQTKKNMTRLNALNPEIVKLKSPSLPALQIAPRPP